VSKIQNELIATVRNASQKILESSDLIEKLFLFEMVANSISSYVFFKPEEELIFAEFVLRVCHGVIQSQTQEETDTKPILSDPRETLDELTELVLKLLVSLEKDKSILVILKDMIVKIYSYTDSGTFQGLL